MTLAAAVGILFQRAIGFASAVYLGLAFVAFLALFWLW
jgi:hypothetical protein